MPVRPTDGRNVKSDTAPAVNDAADGDERAKDFLSEHELATLLDAVIPNSGHWLMEEQPVATVAAIRAFLDKTVR
jgi:pimeloyl-ACP methyl ester carboxylesterase